MSSCLLNSTHTWAANSADNLGVGRFHWLGFWLLPWAFIGGPILQMRFLQSFVPRLRRFIAGIILEGKTHPTYRRARWRGDWDVDLSKDSDTDRENTDECEENSRPDLFEKQMLAAELGFEFSTLLEVALIEQSIAPVAETTTHYDQEVAIDVGDEQRLIELAHGVDHDVPGSRQRQGYRGSGTSKLIISLTLEPRTVTTSWLIVGSWTQIALAREMLSNKKATWYEGWITSQGRSGETWGSGIRSSGDKNTAVRLPPGIPGAGSRGCCISMLEFSHPMVTSQNTRSRRRQCI